MDYHGINMKGPFKGQRVSSLPTWTSDDTGRELYLTTDNKRYYANDVGWIDPNVDKIWTYQDTAPIGWSIVTGTSDLLLACKGGARDYNASGGTQAGTWSMPVHQHLRSHHTHEGGSHPLSIDEMPEHNHTLETYSELATPYGTPSYALWYQAVSGTTGMTGGSQSHSHGTTSSAGGGLSNYNITISTYRPSANIGIVIEKD